MGMQALGRYDPFHLGDQPDPPDTSDAPAARSGSEGINPAQDDMVTGMFRNLSASDADNERTLGGQPRIDAFARLVAHLLALSSVPTEQENRPNSPS